MQLDHIAIALPDEAAVYRWQAILGLAPTHIEEVKGQGVRAYFFETGSVTIECLVPLSPSSPVGRFLEKRGPGLHHIAFYAEDLLAEKDRLAANGLIPLSEVPQPAARGKSAFFFHPRSADGVLVEIVSKAKGLSPAVES